LVSSFLVILVTFERSENFFTLFTFNNRIVWLIEYFSRFEFTEMIVGRGFQSDRFLIQESISNAYGYIFGSMGFIGCLTLIAVVRALVSAQLIARCLQDPVILFFCFRGLFESSFAYFGLDYILLILRVVQVERRFALDR
jgi:hypothetical protein